ncbi:MAG: hypothetical protein ACTHK8_21380 [Ginsengibacter sp.]
MKRLLQIILRERGKLRFNKPSKRIGQRLFLLAWFLVLSILTARADYTVPSGSNINASSITGQSGVLTINGTLTVSSNVNLSGFTSIIINAPNGKIYWSNNSDLTFPAGTTIDIASGAPGLQSNGSNSSQRLIVGSVIIAVSNDKSNAASFSFAQFNQLGGLPQYATSYSAPACSSNSFSATVSPSEVVSGVTYSYSWSISPSAGSFSYNSDHSTATINPGAGTYTVTCVASANTYQTTYSFTVNIPLNYTWLGVTSNWSDLSDWCPGVPNATASVTIPSGVTTPTIESGTVATVNNLTINSGATLIVNGTLQVKGTITNNGTLDLTNGTLEMDGTSAQSIAGSMFEDKTIKNLVVSNSAGLSVSSAANDTLKISGSMTFSSSTATINTGDNVDFLSTQSGTAYLGPLGASNAITGKAIVDRYINVGNSGAEHTKSWQFLSFPTDGSSIKESLMENGVVTAGYGIWLTDPGGTAKGFDGSSYGASIKSYDATKDSWVGVSSASDPIHNTAGYMIFVRGDRTVNGTSVTTPKPTILRSKGTLFTGTLSPITVTAGKYGSIGNPYPAPIDFSQLSLAGGVDDLYYTWDPYLFGSYGYGGYQTISATNGWVPVPGGTSAYPAGVANSTIQSGQAFFVHSTASSSFVAQTPTVTISESSKVADNATNTFSRKALKVSSPLRQFLRNDLFIPSNGKLIIADGNAIAFDSTFSNKLDGNDALKLMNSGENFGIKEGGKLLSVEAKAPLSIQDTITFAMSSLGRKTYQLRIVPVNMQNVELQPFLVDSYLKTSTQLSLSDTNVVFFAVDANSASAASNRFSIVFRQLAALPVTLTSLEANSVSNGILVNWKTQNESGILEYDVQRSTDGSEFETSSITVASNTGSASYQWTDSQPETGANYYRLKTIGKDGKISYSQVVKVIAGKQLPLLVVAPNPIINGNIHLVFKNEPAGNYLVSFANQVGQIVMTKTILHTTLTEAEDIATDNLTKGLYNLSVIKPDGNKEVMKIVVN